MLFEQNIHRLVVVLETPDFFGGGVYSMKKIDGKENENNTKRVTFSIQWNEDLSFYKIKYGRRNNNPNEWRSTNER